jgi:hypothetical protein
MGKSKKPKVEDVVPKPIFDRDLARERAQYAKVKQSREKVLIINNMLSGNKYETIICSDEFYNSLGGRSTNFPPFCRGFIKDVHQLILKHYNEVVIRSLVAENPNCLDETEGLFIFELMKLNYTVDENEKETYDCTYRTMRKIVLPSQFGTPHDLTQMHTSDRFFTYQ